MLKIINKAIYEVALKGVHPEFIFLPSDKYKAFCKELASPTIPDFGNTDLFLFRGITVKDLKKDMLSLISVHPNLAEGFICDRAVMNTPTQQLFKKARVFTLQTLTEVFYENQPNKIFSDN